MTGRYLLGFDAKANSDLSAKQGYSLTFAGSSGDIVDVIASATARFVGVLMNDPKSGDTAEVLYLGQATAVADGSGTAIAAGDLVGPNSSGVMVKKATADYNVAGTSRDACSISGGVIRVLLTPNVVYRALGG
jgi:hypothetical protein